MLKKCMIITTAALMALGMAMPAMAEHYSGGDGWSVSFTPDKKMESNFSSQSMSDTLRNLQPGDDASFRVELSNKNDLDTDWYMSNKVIQSLEDASNNEATAGGAYTYRLTYTDNTGVMNVLFDSDSVGGEMTDAMKRNAGEGLHEATNALENYFFLDDLSKGEGGVVELYIGLDGETQNNDYQDTLAELQMNFAVDLDGEDHPETQPEQPTTTAPENPEQPTTTAPENPEQPTTTTPENPEQPTTTTPENPEQPTTTIPENPEQPTTSSSSGSRSSEGIVRTGDLNNPLMYYIIIGIAGILLLIAAILRVIAGKKREEK